MTNPSLLRCSTLSLVTILTAILAIPSFAQDANDTDWKTRLDTTTRPNLPTWLTPIITPSGLTAPQDDPDPAGTR